MKTALRQVACPEPIAPSNNGVVTVTGKAKNAAEIKLVTKRIEDIHGVKRIYNRMIVE